MTGRFSSIKQQIRLRLTRFLLSTRRQRSSLISLSRIRDRIDNANAIADLALDQFIDMRDRSGSRTQRFAKKGSQFLGAVVPFWWTPLYDMVSFTRIPYATALAKSRRQASTLRSIAAFGLPTAVILIALAFTLTARSGS